MDWSVISGFRVLILEVWPIPGSSGRAISEAFFEGQCQRLKLADLQSLGTKLAVDPERLEIEVDLAFGPLFGPQSRQHAPEILSPVQEYLADDLVKPGDVHGAFLRGIGTDRDDGRFNLGPRPEDRRRQDSHQRDFGQCLDKDGERAIGRGRGWRGHPVGKLALNRHYNESWGELRRSQHVGDYWRGHVIRQVGDKLE